MPVNAPFRRPWSLPQVVKRRSVFATARMPRVSRRARPVPDEGDQWPHPAMRLHRASSPQIGVERSSDWLVFRRLGFAFAAASNGGTLSALEEDVDRESQWTKTPPFE